MSVYLENWYWNTVWDFTYIHLTSIILTYMWVLWMLRIAILQNFLSSLKNKILLVHHLKTFYYNRLYLWISQRPKYYFPHAIADHGESNLKPKELQLILFDRDKYAVAAHVKRSKQFEFQYPRSTLWEFFQDDSLFHPICPSPIRLHM